MKRHVQEAGIRKWSGTDLVELQSEPLKALDSFFGNFGPMILSGCEITNLTLSAGLVVLPETVDGKKIFRIATLAQTEVTAFPVHLKLHKTTINRIYADTGNKPVAYEYTAVVEPNPEGLSLDERNGLLILNTTGNPTFKEVLQDTTHRFVTDREKQYWNDKVSQIRSPFIPFDGIERGGRVIKEKAPRIGYYPQTVYLTNEQTFARKVFPNPLLYIPTYYTDWDGREEFTDFYPENQTQTTTPFTDKLYLCNGVLYFWNGSDLVKISVNEKENYTLLTNKPSINGVTLEGDVSLEALGLGEKACPFTEIIDEDITPIAASTSSNGDIVFLSGQNAFALRAFTPSGGGIIGQTFYYNNWIGAEDYVEFYTPPIGDGSVRTRPPLGRLYSIGQVKYYWDGTGLKVYALEGNGPGGGTAFTEFEGFAEGVPIEMAGTTLSGAVLFARNSRYTPSEIPVKLVNMFVRQVGSKYYSEFHGRDRYSNDELKPYAEKLYKCGNQLYVWDGTTLTDTGVNNSVSMPFGNLFLRDLITEAQVKAVTGSNFELLHQAVIKNYPLLDISRSADQPAQVTGQCKTVAGKKQVTISFPFEFCQVNTLSSLTIYDDFTAQTRHVIVRS